MTDSIIKFNVGGTIFQTRKSTILSKPETTLANFFSEDFKQEEEIFTDKDPKIFRSILNWYRSNVLAIPISVSERLFYQELEYYGISHREMYDKVEWKDEYTKFVEVFMKNYCREYESEVIKNSNEIIIPTLREFSKYCWKNIKIDIEKRFFGEKDISELRHLLVGQKLEMKLLELPEEEDLDPWYVEQKFEKREIESLLKKVEEFHNLSRERYIQREIIYLLKRLGRNAKFELKTIKCETSKTSKIDGTLITPFENAFYPSLLCEKCFLRYMTYENFTELDDCENTEKLCVFSFSD
jgi:hypothetical protein